MEKRNGIIVRLPPRRPDLLRSGSRALSTLRSIHARSLVALATLVALSVLGPSACGPAPAEREVVDLVESFDEARLWTPTRHLRFAEPETLPHLVDGWRRELRVLKTGESFVWSMGARSTLELFLAVPRDRRLVLDVLPPDALAEGDLQLGVALNGEPIGTIALEIGRRAYELVLPASSQRVGINHLHFTNPSAPLRAPTKDVRLLWSSLELRDPTDEGHDDHQGHEGHQGHQGHQSPSVSGTTSGDTDRLLLPIGSRVDYVVDVTATTWLVVDDLRRRGDSGRMVVWFTPVAVDGTTGEAVTDTLEPGVGARLRLGDGDGDKSTARTGVLSLFAEPPTLAERNDERLAEPRSDGRGSAFVVVRPRLVQDAGAPPANDRVADDRVADHRGTEDSTARDTTSQTEAQRPNVIVYLVDTLRADHLSTYGYPLPTSPCLDRFAREATVFERAQAQSPWTRASVASMLTGLWPQQHRVVGDDDALAVEATSLAEILGEAGYYTVGVTSNGNAGRLAGFEQGFDRFDYLQMLSPTQLLATSSDVHEVVVEHLETAPADRPLFLWIHTIDPHSPYDPPEPFRSRFAPGIDSSIGDSQSLLDLEAATEPPSDETLRALRALYDGEIAANDASFCALLDALEAHERFDNSLIVFLSDHGEEFFDHGSWTHGRTLHAEMLDVPLVVRLPGQRQGHRLDAVAEHVDLLPTVVELAGLPARPDLAGDSLLPILRDPEAPWSQTAMAHLDLRGRISRSYIDGRWKLVEHRRTSDDGADTLDLYDTADDPAETRDLVADRAELTRMLEWRADRLAESADTGLERREIDEAELKAAEAELRALGYIE